MRLRLLGGGLAEATLLCCLVACQQPAGEARSPRVAEAQPVASPSEPAPPVAPPAVGPWRHVTGGEVWSTPVAAAGVTYVGSDDGHLYALDVVTGTERWRTAAGAAIRTQPAIDGDILAVSTNKGEVLVFSTDGSISWRRSLGALTGVVIDGDAIVTVIAQAGERSDSVGAAELVRFTEKKILWRQSVGTPAGPPMASGGRVVVASGDGFVTTVESATGRVLWRRQVGSGAASRLAGGTVYAAGGGFLWALRAVDGAEKWRLSGNEFLATPPAVAGSHVLAVAGDGELWIVDAESGLERWHGGLGEPLRAPPAVLGTTAFIGSGDHQFLALDLASGRGVWHFETDAVMTRALAVADGRLIFGSEDGGVHAIPLDLPSASPDLPSTALAIEIVKAPSFHDALPKVVARGRLGTAARQIIADGEMTLAVTDQGIEAWNGGCARGKSVETTARQLWSTTGGAAAVLTDGSFAVADGETVRRLDRKGRELWQTSLQAIAGQPASAAGLVLASDDAGRVWALSAHDGSRRWRRQVEGGGQPNVIQAAPTHGKSTVAVALCGVGLVALDLASGRERWRFTDLECVVASPLIVDELVYAVDAAGTVVAVDLAVGGERWRIGFGLGGRLAPAAHFGMLHVATDDGYLHALDLLRGLEAWRADLGRRPASSPRLLDGIAYLGDHDGTLHAVNALNGDRLWQASLGSPVRGVDAQPCSATLRISAATDAGELVILEL